MANKILNTPGGAGQVPAGKVLVGNGYTGNLSTFNGKLFVFDFENTPDPLNPLNLPDNTIRLLFRDGVTPSFEKGTAVQVSSSPNVWDLTYNNTNWSYLLDENGKSHDLLEVLGANTNDVRNMTNTFRSCANLRTVAIFNTSSVTNFFKECTNLTTVPKYDTSNARDITEMFCSCTNLITIPLFDTHNVTDMYGLFNNCTNLRTVPLLDTSNTTDMTLMFSDCKSLTEIPLFDTSKVTNMNWMFSDSNITTVPLFNTESVIDMSCMFYNCTSLTSVPLFNTQNVTNMANMFYSCEELTNVLLFNTTKVTNVESMFSHCYNVQNGSLALYQQMSSQTNPPVNHKDTFEYCGLRTQTGAAELEQIPSDWK